ncbi:MAG: Beta-lactamase class C-like and penicillin binding proteins (PBPs) superfamily [uncultured Acidimicrobiales bacterium]|uniref:Beta-lactamase class C-like and penicillin binding proteins (PBPs) superfamily n=1 Tax=uncultured Acidimicrobiales bacterium TaxID=310071 RepID=A0A6J4J559_9ACTN|nr:MAG: Beta-lactamase class C-like and penicillin binding proteins (PBPs) superfamily [uncultured Acidimicrobiales bacterium]
MVNVEARLASLFEEVERDLGFSGAVLISQKRQTLFEGAYGLASRQLNVPNTVETRFHIASLTKMFIAMAALALVEDGRIALDRRPAEYLPSLSALDERITLHHLLSHTSGLSDVYDTPNPHYEALKAKHDGMDLLAYLASQRQASEPGDRWSYSSTGYLLVGYVLEQVAGTAFQTLLRDRVLAPLGMTNTGVDRVRRINRGRAVGHTFADGHFANAENDALSPFEEGPGELYSTVGDLKLWCEAVLASPPVAATTLQLMFTPHASIDAVRSYGYGWFLEPTMRFHGGHTPGFLSRITQYPERDLSLIMLMNASHIDPAPVLERAASLVAGASR